jgi:hypothetical protein
LIFGKYSGDVSVIIALVLAVVTIIKNYIDNKRANESQNPIFKVDKIQSFERGKYMLMIKNIRDNYCVIKNVSSSNEKVKCRYEGVMELEMKENRGGEITKEKIYKGHSIEMEILSNDRIKVYLDITGVSITGRKIIVRTPTIEFYNFHKVTPSIQDRFLEFIKK